MADASTQERRQSTRYEESLQVEFYANNGTYRGVSNNSSISGLFIETDNCLAPESIVSIKVHLPDGSLSILKGRVTRVQKMSYSVITASKETFQAGMGIEIIERDSKYIKFFMSLLSDNLIGKPGI